jgi:acyl-CoA thioester hydrolase
MTELGRFFLVTVYYEDTDFSGNVYHAAYLKFFERARTEWLRARGIHHSRLIEDGLAFAVRKMEISFDKPAHIDDLLEVETVVSESTGARVTLSQVLRRNGEVLVTALVQVVMINAAGRPVRLPEGLV